MKKFLVSVLLVSLVSSPAVAGRRYVRVQRTTQTTYSTTYTTTYTQTTADPAGFCAWLNSYRAQFGLRAVGYDQELANWAAVNNQHQASRGLGHFVMGIARRQNSGMGHFSAVVSMWTKSPGHNAALLDPAITAVGIASHGSYWTFNAR